MKAEVFPWVVVGLLIWGLRLLEVLDDVLGMWGCVWLGVDGNGPRAT